MLWKMILNSKWIVSGPQENPLRTAAQPIGIVAPPAGPVLLPPANKGIQPGKSYKPNTRI
jgi:hypothetical protein